MLANEFGAVSIENPLRPTHVSRRTFLALPVAILMAGAFSYDGQRALAAVDCDSLQTACYIGPAAPAIGRLNSPEQTDWYRFEALDFGTILEARLRGNPDYRITLFDPLGKPLATSQPQIDGSRYVRYDAYPPGNYFAAVDSSTGQYDQNSYALERNVGYPHNKIKIPDILYSSDFRADAKVEAFTGDNEFATYSQNDGKYTVALKVGGQLNAGRWAASAWGNEYTDSTISAIARITKSTSDPLGCGFIMGFRTNLDTGYQLDVNGAGQARLSIVRNRQVETNTGWIRTSTTDAINLVNHVVIHNTGKRILVVLNGSDIFDRNDETYVKGKFAFGAASWRVKEEGLVTTSFDNVLVTTPAEGHPEEHP